VATYGSDADVWNVLGDRTRRTILECLVEQPLAVVDIADRLPVSRPAVSQHLRVLKDAGLVRDHRDGNRRIYAVQRDGLAALRVQLDQFWNDALTNFKTLVEQANQEDE
jgi:DNA-binding transcriptional ArsR family regulator